MSKHSVGRIASRLELLSWWAGVLVALLGGLVLAAWALDIGGLQGLRSELVEMKANTALAFLLAGLSLLLPRREPAGGRRRFGQILAAAVLAVGALTLLEYLSGWDLGIDQLLFQDRASMGGIGLPGPMAPQAAVGFLMIGLALLLLDGQTARDRSPAPFLALGAGLLAIEALIGYTFGEKGFYLFRSYTPVAPHSALGFALLSLGVLCARPSRGPVAVLTADDAGGWMARRLLLAVLLIPPIMAWLRSAAERAGYFNAHFGLSLLVLSSMATLVAVVWWNARSLSQLDAARREREARLAAIIDSAMDAIITIDEAQRITVFNRAAEQIFRCSAADALGRPIDRFLPERYRQGHREHIHTFGRTGVTTRAMSARPLVALRADGEAFPMEASISQAQVGDEQLYTVILRDLSERQRMERALERESHIAATLQQACLPASMPECPGYRFGAIYRPALREAEVGGDFYDLFSLPGGQIGLLLGDVSGKGLAAATFAAMTRYMARAYAFETGSPAAVLTRLNRALCMCVGDDGLFVTAIYAVLDPETGRLQFANAGHWPPLIHHDDRCRPLETHSAVLGVIPGETYREEQFQLEPGDEVVFFTDGLVEIGHEDPTLQQQAVQELLAEQQEQSPQQQVERLHENAVRCSGGLLRDDVAILCLRCDRVPCPARSVAPVDGRVEREEPLLRSAAGAAVIASPSVTTMGCTLTFRVEGALDIGTVPAMEDWLRQLVSQRPGVLVIDLREVIFLDTAGVRLILQAARWQQAVGNRLEIASAQGMVREVLTHCRLL